MSQISAIANHFLTSRAPSGVKRIALIGVRDTLPVSFLAANLALEGARAGKRVMAIQGEKGETDLGFLFRKKSLTLLGEGNHDSEEPSSLPGINLVPFCLTPEGLRNAKPPQWEEFRRQEEEAELLLIVLPGDTTLRAWAPILKSLHAVVLQTPVGEKHRSACYQILRFLYFHNPFLRVHLVGLLSSSGEEGTRTTTSDGLSFYEQLAGMADRFFRQELIGPYLGILEGRSAPAPSEAALPVQPSTLAPFLDRLVKTLLTEEPVIDRAKFSGLFASLEAAHSPPPTLQWDKADLFARLEDYFPLDFAVGPKKASLLLNWERRLAVGETAGEGVGEALVRGAELLEWAHDHLPLLARLYRGKLDPALPPHLLLIAPDYPAGFCGAVGRLGLPVVLYKAYTAEKGTRVERVSPLLQRPFSQKLSSEEESALLGSNSGKGLP